MDIPLLAGIRVLDFSRVWSGPYCTMMLAELGADVLKVESPDGGDETRRYPPFFASGESQYFASFNRGKRSIIIDLKREESRDVIARLVQQVDAVIENFSPGVTTRLGIDYPRLSAVNPRIVYCSISAFGQTGPLSPRRGYDPILQAMSGIMSLTGEPGRPPVRVGVAIADLSAALFASFALVAALLARERGGPGQYIDLALLDSQVSLLAVKAAEYLDRGIVPRRWGSKDPHRVPSGAYETLDGGGVMVIAGEQHWPAFCRVISRPDLLERVEYRTMQGRVDHREELEAILEPIFRTRTAAEWQLALDAAGVPVGPIQNLHEMFTHPQIVARGLVKEYDHARAGRVRGIDMPYKFSRSPERQFHSPPGLGANTTEILQSIAGFTDEQIEELIRAKVVHTHGAP